MVTWTVNIPTLLTVLGAAFLLYGRIVALETKIKPIWEWWNTAAERRRTPHESEG